MVVALIATGCGIPNYTGAWVEPQPQRFTTGPYVMFGGPQQAFVALKAPLEKAPAVHWRQDVEGAQVHRVTAVASDDLWIATLSDLPKNARIAYQVHAAGQSGPTHHFRSGPASKTSFRFAAFGDTRTGHSVHRAVVEALAAEKIDFVLHTGDMVDSGGVIPEWDLFFKIERPLLAKTPLIPAIGNHDKGGREYFRHYFLHEQWAPGRRYFVHDWGNLRVVSMDGGIECRQGCPQFRFVARALAEGAKKGMLMVMMLHFPPFSSGAHGSNLAVQGSVSALAKRYGVELVVAGHDHNYERTKPIDGTTYIVSGSAGAPIRPVTPRSFSASSRTEPHYVLVDCEPHRLIIRAVNLRGNAFDTYVVEDNPPQPDE